MCSVLSKLDQIYHIIHDLKIDVLCLSETRLNSYVTDAQLSVDGFTLVRKDRTANKGGGIMIYLKKSLRFMFCNQLNDDHLETLWCHIKHRNSLFKSFLICCFYRSPSAKTVYQEIFSENIEKAVLLNPNIIILGDFNCNMLPQNDSNTIIDLILTSIPEAHTSSEVVKVTLSGHFLITTTVANNMQNDNEATVCTKIDYTNFNIEQFVQDISHCFHNFSVSDLNVSAENYWLLWKKLFNDICEQHAPLYHYKVRPKGRP